MPEADPRSGVGKRPSFWGSQNDPPPLQASLRHLIWGPYSDPQNGAFSQPQNGCYTAPTFNLGVVFRPPNWVRFQNPNLGSHHDPWIKAALQHLFITF